MKRAVFYFTGTGNSYHIARRLSVLLEAELIPIAGVMKGKKVAKSFDVIGLVYPVYYANTPNIVREFCRTYDFSTASYVFAVSNYGGGKGESIKTVRDILESRNHFLSASFGVQMTQNAFVKKYENKDRVFNASEVMVRRIASVVKEGRKGFFSQNRLLDLIAHLMLFMIKPLFKKHLIKMSGLEKGASLEQAVYRLDGSFTAGSGCTGCGTCAAVCPVDNIIMDKGKPQWQHRCENCLACVNFCPENAIENEITNNGFNYLHPDYSLREALNQKRINTPFD